MAEQNKVRELAKKQGRKLVWLGVQIGVSRSLFDWKLDNDHFTQEQMEVIAAELNKPVTYVFPYADPERAIA